MSLPRDSPLATQELVVTRLTSASKHARAVRKIPIDFMVFSFTPNVISPKADYRLGG
jgi:hypothetical protein